MLCVCFFCDALLKYLLRIFIEFLLLPCANKDMKIAALPASYGGPSLIPSVSQHALISRLLCSKTGRDLATMNQTVNVSGPCRWLAS